MPDRNKESEGKKYRGNLIAILNKLDIKYIDLTNKDFYKLNKNFSKYGTHFNPNGYKEMSNTLAFEINKLIH